MTAAFSRPVSHASAVKRIRLGLALAALTCGLSTAGAWTFSGASGWHYDVPPGVVLIGTNYYYAATNDLANVGSPTMASTAYSGANPGPWSSSPTNLNDGRYCWRNPASGGYPDGGETASACIPATNNTYTVNFAGGMDIANIVVYSSSASYPQGRAKQNWKLEYRLAGDTLYQTLIASVPQDQTWNRSGQYFNKVSVTLGGYDLKNVDSLRFTFLRPETNAVVDQPGCPPTELTYYREIEIFGSPASNPLEPFSQWQARYFGSFTNPAAAPFVDPDGDGLDNFDEFIVGFNPTNATASLRVLNAVPSGSNWLVTYLGSNGNSEFSPGPRTNVLEFTPQLPAGSNWAAIATNVLTGGTGQGAIVAVTHAGAITNLTGFYRVRLPLSASAPANVALADFETPADASSWNLDGGVTTARSSAWSSSGSYSLQVSVPPAPWNGVSKTFTNVLEWQTRENLEFDLRAGATAVDYITAWLDFPGMMRFFFRVDKLQPGEVRHVVIPISDMDQLRSATNVTLHVEYGCVDAPVTFFLDNIQLTGDAPALRKIKRLQNTVLARDASIRALGDASINNRLSALETELNWLASGPESYAQHLYDTELAVWNSLLADWSTLVLQARGIATPDYTVGFESTMRKVKQADTLGLLEGDLSRSNLNLSVARNEYESVQLVLAPLRKSLQGVTVAATDLSGPGGSILSRTNIEIRLVGEVDISGTQRPETASLTGLWPDPLLNYGAPVSVSIEKLQCVWVTVYAPTGQTPGLYLGTLTVATTNSHAYAINIAVNVRNFALPKQATLKTYCGLHSYPLRKFYTSTPAADLDNLLGFVDYWDFQWDSPSLTTVGKWTAFAQKYRLTPGAPFGWGLYDQKLSNPYMWPVAATNGIVQFSQWNAWMGSNINQGMNSLSVMGVSKDPGLAQKTNYIALVNQFLPQMQSNLVANGWADLSFIYLPDEPAWNTLGTDFLDVATLLKGLAPNLKTFATTAPPYAHSAYSNLLNVVDIFCPLLDGIPTTVKNGLQQSGKEIWWYTCFIPFDPYPHLGVHQEGMDARILPWMTWKFNLDGLLYWGLDVFGDTNMNSTAIPKWPAGSWSMQGYPYTPGDGMLMYPGPNGQPWSSVRLEQLRDGLEDYEYLALLSKSVKYLSISQPANMASLKTQAQNLLSGVSNLVATPINFTHNAQDVANYRENVAGLLDQIAPPVITFVDDFSVSNHLAWSPSPSATDWVTITNVGAYQVNATLGNQSAVSMIKRAEVGTGWKLDTDVEWIRSNYSADAGYGVAGMILANSSTSPLSGDYLTIYLNRATNSPTQNWIRLIAEWRINGVTGSYYPSASVETTSLNRYHLTAQRAAGGSNVVVTLTANGVAPMSFTISAIPAASLNTLRHPGLAAYFSVNQFKNILITEN